MPVLRKKPTTVEMMFYRKLPTSIKHILGGPDNVDMTSAIMQEAAIGEELRPYLNTVVFGLFVGELDPKDLVEGVKEWLGLETAKSELVAALVRKTFVEPHQDFLENLYKKSPTPPLQSPPDARSNVVNLKQAP